MTATASADRRSHLPPKGTAGYRVEGKTFIVRTVAAGWEVRFGGFAGIDADLEEATRLALSGGQGRNVCSVAPRVPTRERERTVMPRTTPRLRVMR